MANSNKIFRDSGDEVIINKIIQHLGWQFSTNTDSEGVVTVNPVQVYSPYKAKISPETKNLTKKVFELETTLEKLKGCYNCAYREISHTDIRSCRMGYPCKYSAVQPPEGHFRDYWELR